MADSQLGNSIPPPGVNSGSTGPPISSSIEIESTVNPNQESPDIHKINEAPQRDWVATIPGRVAVRRSNRRVSPEEIDQLHQVFFLQESCPWSG